MSTVSGFPFQASEDDSNLVSLSHSVEESASSPSPTSLLFNLSVLKDKLSQMQTLASVLISSGQSLPDSTSMAIVSMNSIIQEFTVTASSMMLTCQHMVLNFPPGTTLLPQPQSNFVHSNNTNNTVQERGQSLFSSSDQTLDWFGSESYDHNSNCDPSVEISEIKRELCQGNERHETNIETKNCDIIELGADDLLAKYTHYCQICGKGFKRDANLRMHMRAHGDEYKTSSALSNPMKNREKECSSMRSNVVVRPKKYSCPQEGCRWNQRHAKFQPLKSMICVKNHYKRSHCPKMYVCKRCNVKQFSVLSDLRTHEKHCGDQRWQCSCGTTFSRKDKLMGHVALFVGHAPASSARLLQVDGSSR